MTKERQLDVNKFVNKFENGWWNKLKPFILSRECYDIYQQLKENNKVIYPASVDVFQAFRMSGYSGIRGIIIGQSPYHTHENGVPYADGLAFSCGHVKKLSPSLRVLYDAIEDDVVKRMVREPNLGYLAIQDILLLNVSLTIDRGDKDSFGKHNVIWQPFIEYLFKECLSDVTGIPIMMFGKPAEEQIVPLLGVNQPYRCVKHPAYYARREEPMEHGGIFSWSSEIAEKNNGNKIYWNANEAYDNVLPF